MPEQPVAGIDGLTAWVGVDGSARLTIGTRHDDLPMEPLEALAVSPEFSREVIEQLGVARPAAGVPPTGARAASSANASGSAAVRSPNPSPEIAEASR